MIELKKITIYCNKNLNGRSDLSRLKQIIKKALPPEFSDAEIFYEYREKQILNIDKNGR